MLGTWLQDIEGLEAISQDAETRALFLRMAAMSRAGTLAPFIADLDGDDELDDETKVTLAELAEDATFLLAVEDYLDRTRVLH